AAGVGTVLWPPFPLLPSLLDAPLAAPASVTGPPALILTGPPGPPAWVPLSIRAPPATVRVLRSSVMSPAGPAPCVFTEIFAPSLIASDGATASRAPIVPAPPRPPPGV